MPSFAVSIVVLSLVQGAVVTLPRHRAFPRLERLRAPAWAAVPAGSVVVVIIGLRAVAATAQGLTYLALLAVPATAALALGVCVRGARPAWVVGVAPLFALAWADRGGLAGEGAALALTVLACVALGGLLSAVAPGRWLKAGIVLMACVDTALVVSDLLQAPNRALNAAAPAAHLPQLQEAAFGHAVMGFGDLFVAGVLGAVLAGWPTGQRRAAVLTAAFALGLDLLFFLVHELPATVPVALALIAHELAQRRHLARRAPHGPDAPATRGRQRRPRVGQPKKTSAVS